MMDLIAFYQGQIKNLEAELDGAEQEWLREDIRSVIADVKASLQHERDRS